MKTVVKINASSFGKKFDKMLDSNKFKKAANDKMAKIFKVAHRRMLGEFNASEVTKEIEAGPLSENISGTIGGGYGNLYSFIGFDVSKENPIEPLRRVLENANFNITTRRGRNWYFKIQPPSKVAIENATIMEWEHSSWAEGIEEGISGLNNYMFAHWDDGYSKEGFQLKYENLSNIGFITKPYLTPILENFRESFE